MADGCCVWVDCCGCAIDMGNVVVPEIPPVCVDQNGCRLVTVGAISLACLVGQLMDSVITPVNRNVSKEVKMGHNCNKIRFDASYLKE